MSSVGVDDASRLLCNQGKDCSKPEFKGTLFDRCINGCSGVGECIGGFCRCPRGRWGIDCSRTQVRSFSNGTLPTSQVAFCRQSIAQAHDPELAVCLNLL